MARKTSGFTIKEKDLADALEISVEQLDKIICFFDADPADEWELKENDHFIFLNKKWNERLFSQHGAFAIAKYLDTHEKKSIWDKVVEFITKHKQKIRNAFVRQKVLDNCSSLTLRNNRHFLSKKDVVNILCTSYTRLNKAFDDIQKRDPMIFGEDFDDFDGVRYYSLSGLYKFCQELSQTLTVKDRCEWCEAVEIVGKKTFKALIDEEASIKKQIDAAMTAAKKRDKEQCQLTGKKPVKHQKINMAAHHLFSKEHYPQLATSIDNLITLTEEVHKEFHAWNGGCKKACTIDDFISFVTEQYPEQDKISIVLSQRKKMLGHPSISIKNN